MTALPAVDATRERNETEYLLAATMPTPIGPLTVLAAGTVVRAAGFTDDVSALAKRLSPDMRTLPVERAGELGSIGDELAAYFAGDLRALGRIAVAQDGGPFRQRVWEALRAIPPGRPTTYREIAVSLGGEPLARAVGMGCATNAIAPIVPCHRVMRTSGSLAGYLWGLERKRWLLDHERRHAPGDE